MYVEYDSNNSGGHWWLKDEDWHALEKAGWIVRWAWLCEKYNTSGAEYLREKNGVPKLEKKDLAKEKYSWDKIEEGGRYMGALSKTAYKPDCSSLREAAEEFDRITSQCSTDAGCPCCGQPHNFTLYDDKGKYIDSGPSVSYEASW